MKNQTTHETIRTRERAEQVARQMDRKGDTELASYLRGAFQEDENAEVRVYARFS